MHYSYVVVSTDEAMQDELTGSMALFPDFFCVGSADSYNNAINSILEFQPELVFLDIASKGINGLSLILIAELGRYLTDLPYFVVLNTVDVEAYNSLKAGAFDYLLAPLSIEELRKTLFRFKKIIPVSKENQAIIHPVQHLPEKQPIHTSKADNAPPEFSPIAASENQKSDIDIQICIKSYGDYQFIALKDIVYLKADNNTTDFFLHNGKKFTAYKTLKHYENNLPQFFYRIHNSYIVNSNYVSRINTGKQLCYLNNNEISIPFSKTFKDSIDRIISEIAPDYL